MDYQNDAFSLNGKTALITGASLWYWFCDC